MRLQWTRQFAQIDSTGLLHITSSAVYDKRCYSLLGGTAVLIDYPACENTTSSQATIQIRLDPNRQHDGETSVVLRLFAAADAGLWIPALSRFVTFNPPPATSAAHSSLAQQRLAGSVSQTQPCSFSFAS